MIDINLALSDGRKADGAWVRCYDDGAAAMLRIGDIYYPYDVPDWVPRPLKGVVLLFSDEENLLGSQEIIVRAGFRTPGRYGRVTGDEVQGWIDEGYFVFFDPPLSNTTVFRFTGDCGEPIADTVRRQYDR